METTMSRQVRVGIFAAIGLVLFCVSIILLSGDKFLFARTYSLRLRLPQVQGLARGSVVSLAGVPVGNVDTLKFVEKSNVVEISMSVERDVQNRITEGSFATIKTQGALGDKYIYIQAGPPDAAPLKDNALLETDKTPDFLDVIASNGSAVNDAMEVIKEMRVLMANVNRDGRSGKLMFNMVQTTNELSQTLSEARETFRFMRNETLVPLSSVMKKLDRGQGTLGALINDSSLHNRLINVFGDTPRNRFLKPLLRESIETNEK